MVVPFEVDNPPSSMIRKDARILRTGLGQTVYGGAQFTFASENGTFVYAEGTTPLGLTEGELLWVDPEDGNTVPIPDSEEFYDEWARPRLSPDENLIALHVATETHLSLYKFGAGWLGSLTSLKGCQGGPAWEPGGNRIAFYHQSANSPPDVYWQPRDDSDAADLLLKTVNSEQGTSFSPDGKYLAMTVHFVDEASRALTSDIWMLNMQTREPEKWIETPPYNEWGADFSPDGKWIAYVSNETGDNEVWVKEFRGNNREKISTNGGSEVIWGPDKNRLELFYRGPRQFWRAEVETESGFKVVQRKALFDDMYVKTKFPGHRCYDFSKKRNQFLMIEKLDERRKQHYMNVILNWYEELKRLAPTGKNQ
jgi:Tol biopolymer transport system component